MLRLKIMQHVCIILVCMKKLLLQQKYVLNIGLMKNMH